MNFLWKPIPIIHHLLKRLNKMDVFQGSDTSKDRIKCDTCSQYPIEGISWKCNECANYYFCSSCYEKYSRAHAKAHAFTKMEPPKTQTSSAAGPSISATQPGPPTRDRVECSICSLEISNENTDCAHFHICSTCHNKYSKAHARSTNTLKRTNPAESTKGSHPGVDAGPSTPKKASGDNTPTEATCVTCNESPIKGVRWKWKECENLCFCSSCYEKNSKLHAPSHIFSKIEIAEKKTNPSASAGGCYPVNADLDKTPKASKVPAKCKTCNECPIKGARWKCNECANFYFCTTCNEKNSKLPASLHIFKKMGAKNIQKDDLPSNWKHMAKLETEKKVPLPRSSEDFILLETNFLKTMGNNKIIKIERIQSKRLLQNFYEKRAQMERINGRVGANEMQLFHGTKMELLEGICRNNIDARQAGTHVGGILENGIYFSKEATYADRSAPRDPKTGHRFMLQCRVLVGKFSNGSKGPLERKDVSGRLHDSCVDDINNPVQFCIFDKGQCYPEYIIEYQ